MSISDLNKKYICETECILTFSALKTISVLDYNEVSFALVQKVYLGAILTAI